MSQEQRPSKQLLLKWYAATSQIEERNKAVSRYAEKLCEQMHNDGFETCVLKWQGVEKYYPNPLRRQSGDIDVWLRTVSGSLQQDRIKTIDYVQKSSGTAKARFHNVDYDENRDIPVELHFMPTFLNNSFHEQETTRMV